MSRKLRSKEVALVTGRNRAWFIIMDKVVSRCCSHRKNARESRNNKNVAKIRFVNIQVLKARHNEYQHAWTA